MSYLNGMVSLFLLFCALLPTSCSNRHKPVVEKGSDIAVKVYSVNGSINSTRAYCGGIRPSDEQLAELKRPQPYSNRTLFVKQGDKTEKDWVSKPAFHSFSTDDNGNFDIKLPEGTYGIFVDSKNSRYDTPYAQGAGKTFCDQWRNAPDMIWTVGKSSKKQAYTIHISCNPCREPAK